MERGEALYNSQLISETRKNCVHFGISFFFKLLLCTLKGASEVLKDEYVLSKQKLLHYP